jgi:hypothetical protein
MGANFNASDPKYVDQFIDVLLTSVAGNDLAELFTPIKVDKEINMLHPLQDVGIYSKRASADATITPVSPQAVGSMTATVEEYDKLVEIAESRFEDNPELYGQLLSIIAKRGADTLNYSLSLILANAFTTASEFDSVALSSASHPLTGTDQPPTGGASTWSNYGTSSLAAAAVYAVWAAMQRTPSEQAIPEPRSLDWLVVAPEKAGTAHEICNSLYGSSNLQVQFLAGKVGYKVCPWLSSTTQWFAASKQGENGLFFMFRVNPADIRSGTDDKQFQRFMSARMRYVASWKSARGFYGTYV